MTSRIRERWLPSAYDEYLVTCFDVYVRHGIRGYFYKHDHFSSIRITYFEHC